MPGGVVPGDGDPPRDGPADQAHVLVHRYQVGESQAHRADDVAADVSLDCAEVDPLAQ